VINFAAITAGIFSWAERRWPLASRAGWPNRWAGRLSAVGRRRGEAPAQGGLVPEEADKFLFRIAPYFMMVGFACVFVALRSATRWWWRT